MRLPMGRQLSWLERLTSGRWHSPVELAQRVEILAEKDEAESLIFLLVVDEQVLSPFDQGWLDLEQLELSFELDGVYFLWTCECGDSGCAGMWKGVKVRHVGDLVEWRDLDNRVKFAFRLADLRQAMREIVAKVRRLLEEDPKLCLAPSQNSEFFKRKK